MVRLCEVKRNEQRREDKGKVRDMKRFVSTLLYLDKWTTVTVAKLP